MSFKRLVLVGGALCLLGACAPSTDELALKANELFAQEIYEQAVPLYEKILGQEPDNPNALSKAAISYFYMREWQKVIDYGTRALDKGADFYAVFQLLGLAYEAENKLDKALAIYQEGMKQFPDRTELFQQAGLLAYKQKNYREAERAFLHLLKINPQDIEAALNLATLMEKETRYTEAETLVKGLLEKQPQNVGLLFRMASIQENMSQWDSAIRYYQDTLLQNPQHLSALYNLAQLQVSHRKDKAAAIKAWKQYIAVAGKNKGQESFVKDAQKQLQNLEGGAS